MITNILIGKGGYNRGYLPKRACSIVQPVFATANLAVRKEVFKQVGLFDAHCQTGEDVDLGLRVAQTAWEMYFEPSAIINHKHRTALMGLLKQWYRYGSYHPYIFKKHNPKCLKVYYPVRTGLGWSCLSLFHLLRFRFPLHVLIFATAFHILNIFFVLVVLSLIMKSAGLLKVALSCWLIGLIYFQMKSFVAGSHPKRICWRPAYFILRYILNWAYTLGAFISGLKIGVIYLEATREQTPVT